MFACLEAEELIEVTGIFHSKTAPNIFFSSNAPPLFSNLLIEKTELAFLR